MNELQSKYGKENKQGCQLQIFGFPCNQFGYQEPAENFELMNCLKYVRPGYGFVPNFPLSGKLFVNGANESPIFTYLKVRCAVSFSSQKKCLGAYKARCAAPMGLIANRTDITWTPIRNNDISWNFQKWLIDHNGQPFRRFTSRTTPQAIEDDIIRLLEKCDGEISQSNTTDAQVNNTEQVANTSGGNTPVTPQPIGQVSNNTGQGDNSSSGNIPCAPQPTGQVSTTNKPCGNTGVPLVGNVQGQQISQQQLSNQQFMYKGTVNKVKPAQKRSIHHHQHHSHHQKAHDKRHDKRHLHELFF